MNPFKALLAFLISMTLVGNCANAATLPRKFVMPTSIVYTPRGATLYQNNKATGDMIFSSIGARLYINKVLVDSIWFAKDGSATHVFNRTQVVVDKRPLPQQLARVNRQAPDCSALDSAMTLANMNYAGATLAMVAALGTGVAVEIVSLGLASLAVIGNFSVIIFWCAAAQSRDDAYNNAQAAGC